MLIIVSCLIIFCLITSLACCKVSSECSRIEEEKLSGKYSRNKGKVGEREVASISREHGFTDSRRGQQYHGGGDSPDVLGIPGLHLEVKRVEKLNLKNAMAQSSKDAAEGEIPVVVHRKSREPWYITLDFESFLDLYAKIVKIQ